jgi:hypothetical protein
MIVKSLHEKPHLTAKYWAMAYYSCIYNLNLRPVKSMGNQCPHNIWANRKLDINAVPTLPFGTIVMAHIPVKLQHALGGRSQEMIVVGSAPGYKGGILLFNPLTKKYIVRRSFKSFGDQQPVSPIYKISVEFESLEHKPELLQSHIPTSEVLSSQKSTPVHITRSLMQSINKFSSLSSFDEDDGFSSDGEHSTAINSVNDRSTSTGDNIRRSGRARKPSFKTVNFADAGYLFKGWEYVLRTEAQHALKIASRASISPSLDTEQDPRSFDIAKTLPDAPLWIAAKDNEMQSFRDHSTYHKPDVPIESIDKSLILPSKIVLTRCKNPDGSFKKCKFRLCIQGNRQRVSSLIYDTLAESNYAGTVKSESLRMLLSIACELDWELVSWDVGTAFLHPKLKPGEIIYMRRPKGLTDEDMPEVVQLDKCIYGLRQASAYFREHSDKALKSIGFTPLISDPQVYKMTVDGELIIVSTHVDDFGVMSPSKRLIASVKAQLSKVYKLSEVPNMTHHLGLKIDRDRVNRSLFISQPAYIADMLTTIQCGCLQGCEHTNDRGPRGPPQAAQLEVLTLLPVKLHELFMKKVGSLLYLAMDSRPDILHAVTSLSRFCQAPSAVHMKAADHVLSYVSSTRELGLTLHSGEGIVLYATVDASYAYHKDLKSHTGCTLHIGRHSGSVLTQTKKQTVTADSSTVAEFIAAHYAAKQIMWARNFLSELGFAQGQPTTLFEDNKSTIALINNKGNGSKTKHIELRYQFIREQVALGHIKLEYLCTEDMTSDMLTKVTGPTTFLHLRPRLLGSIV